MSSEGDDLTKGLVRDDVCSERYQPGPWRLEKCSQSEGLVSVFVLNDGAQAKEEQGGDRG